MSLSNAPTTLPPLSPVVGSNPFIKFGDPSKAPTLEYNLPQSTSFRVDFQRSIPIPLAYFGPDPAPTPALLALQEAKAATTTPEQLTEQLRRDLISGESKLLGGAELLRTELSAVQVDVVQVPTPVRPPVAPGTKPGTAPGVAPGAALRQANDGNVADTGPDEAEAAAAKQAQYVDFVQTQGVNPALAVPELSRSGKVPLAKAAAAQVRVAGVPLDYIVAQIKAGKLPQVYQKLSGATALRFLDVPDQAQPELRLVQHLVVRSYLGNYGAGRVVKTFSLLPGERTTITVKSFRDQTQSEATTAASSASAYTNSEQTTSANSAQTSVSTRAENALDSFSEASANELERMVAEETGEASNNEYGGYSAGSNYGSAANTTTNTNSRSRSFAVGGGARVTIGPFSGGASASRSGTDTSGNSTTNSTTSGYSNEAGTNYGGGTSEMTQALNSALDRHVAQSASNRQLQVNTTTGGQAQTQAGQANTAGSGTNTQTTTTRQLTNSLTTSDENLTTRELSNLNQSRTLNFVFRQMQQEYVTITYLDNVSFVFSDGMPGRTRVVRLPDLRAFLKEVLVEEAQVAEILQQALRTVQQVQDYRHQTVAFAEVRVETLPGGTGNETTAQAAGGAQRPTTAPNAALPSGTPPPQVAVLPPREVRYYAKRRSLYERATAATDADAKSENTYGMFHVPGIILDVTSRILPTDSVLVDSVLGQGEALDYYNLALQEEAVQQARRENERRAAETEALRSATVADQDYRAAEAETLRDQAKRDQETQARDQELQARKLELAQKILESIDDPIAKATAFRQMLGECCDDKLLDRLRLRDAPLK